MYTSQCNIMLLQKVLSNKNKTKEKDLPSYPRNLHLRCIRPIKQMKKKFDIGKRNNKDSEMEGLIKEKR